MNKKIKDKENITCERKSAREYMPINNIFKNIMMTGIVFSLLINVAAATDFGDIIGTYRGIDAKSNGPCTGLYSGTYENTNCGLSKNWKYQCKEYVNRFYKDIMGIDTSKWAGSAGEYYATASAKGLDAYPNGGDTSPQPNDILTFSGGPYGHVAIITWVDDKSVKVVEQNFNRDTAYATLKRNGNTIQNHITSTGITYTVQGWLRKNGPRYTITTSTSPAGLSPQPTGAGTYNSGASITVIAQPVTGYAFQRWTENGNQVSTSASYPFTVNGNRNLVAVYQTSSQPIYDIPEQIRKFFPNYSRYFK